MSRSRIAQLAPGRTGVAPGMTWGGRTVPNWDPTDGPAIQGATLASRKYSPRFRFGTDECTRIPDMCAGTPKDRGVPPPSLRASRANSWAQEPRHIPCVRVQQNARTGHASSRGGRLLIMAVGDEKPCLESCAVITRMHLCGHPLSICPNPSPPGGGVEGVQGGECSGPRSVALWHGHEKRRESAHTVRVEQ